MAYVAICEDRTDIPTDGLRGKTLDEHLSYIRRILPRLLVAGPVSEPASGEYRTSLFVYDVDDEAAARELLHNDPYYRAGIYGEVRIAPFRPVAGQWPGGIHTSRGDFQ